MQIVIGSQAFDLTKYSYVKKATKKSPEATIVWPGPLVETNADKARLFGAILEHAEQLKEGSSATVYDRILGNFLEEAYDGLVGDDGSFEVPDLANAYSSVRRAGGMSEKELVAKQIATFKELDYLVKLLPAQHAEDRDAEEAASRARMAAEGLAEDEVFRRFHAVTTTLTKLVELASAAEVKKAERAAKSAAKAATEAAAKAGAPSA